MDKSKVDLNEAARLRRILKGTEKKPSGMDRKLAEMRERAEKKAQEEQAKEKARNAAATPALSNKARLEAIRRALKIKGAEQDPGLENRSFMFSLSGKFYFAAGREFKKITEADVSPTITDNPAVELHSICVRSAMCPLPKVFTGHKSSAKMVPSIQAALHYINELTGLAVKQNQL